MKYVWSAIGFIFVWCSSLTADFCSAISEDLKGILRKSACVDGELHSVIPFPGQGGSFINQIYLVETDRGEQLVLKVENTNWQREKTLNEVVTLNYLKKHTSIPVPEVVAYESAISDSSIGHEYIIMTRVEGEPLNFAFDGIYANRSQYRRLLEQLADILAEIKTVSCSSIGSLQGADSLHLKCPMDFANLGYETPCRDFSEYAQRWLSYFLREMKTLRERGHPNARYFEKYIPYVEAIMDSFSFSRLNREGEEFPFSHQDFVMKNILVKEGSVTAVLDWEWSGTAAAEFEAKTGCDFLQTSEDRELFAALLERRGVKGFFDPPSAIRQDFYRFMGDLYTLISCYEWTSGKLIHSAKFLDQKLEQRRIRKAKEFDMEAYVEETAHSLDRFFNEKWFLQ